MRVIGCGRLDLPADDVCVEVACAGRIRRHELVPDEASAIAVVGHSPIPPCCARPVGARRSHPLRYGLGRGGRCTAPPSILNPTAAKASSLLPRTVHTNLFLRGDVSGKCLVTQTSFLVLPAQRAAPAPGASFPSRQAGDQATSTPTGQWSDPVTCGQMNASVTRFAAAGDAST